MPVSAFQNFRNSYNSLAAGAPVSINSNTNLPNDDVVKSTGKGFRVYGAAGDAANLLLGKPASSAESILADLKNRIPSKSGGAPSGGAPSGGAPSGADLSGGAPSQPQLADYLDAPWASAYGMSKETAYAEAMENTAYRRSVADMQKAGLNPAVIFGAGNGYTAGSPSYVRSAGSSGSGGSGYSRRSSGSGKSSGKLFSSSAYSVLSVLGGIAGVAATGNAGGYWIGTSLAQGAMNAASLLSRR